MAFSRLTHIDQAFSILINARPTFSETSICMITPEATPRSSREQIVSPMPKDVFGLNSARNKRKSIYSPSCSRRHTSMRCAILRASSALSQMKPPSFANLHPKQDCHRRQWVVRTKNKDLFVISRPRKASRSACRCLFGLRSHCFFSSRTKIPPQLILRQHFSKYDGPSCRHRA